MSDDAYAELPILPEESRNLSVHVRQCTLRYNALRSAQFQVRDELRKLRSSNWIYQAIMYPMVAAIFAKLFGFI